MSGPIACEQKVARATLAVYMQGKEGVLVFNPRSGKGKATVRARDFADHWKMATGNELRLRATRSLADIRIAARERESEQEIQIFMGGDGTLSESLQGLAEANDFQPLQRAVAFLPGGTGNSFLRDFGITSYEEARDAALSAIRDSSQIAIDSALIEYDSVNADKPTEKGPIRKRIMFNIWGVGLVSDITAKAIRMRHIGDANYTVAALQCMSTHKMYRNKFKVNDRGFEELDYNFISISNSQYTGGSMHIAPTVRINDGQLYMLRSAIESRFNLLRQFPKVFKGAIAGIPRIYTEMIQSFAMETHRPVLMNVDGELEEGWNPRLHMIPAWFQLYMPTDRVAD
ncbi:MAG: hypothetical protein KDK39_16015 [Leptospiraceae bacterium]|nr:hypothetical protein [Leptospiraceae bacterium]